MRVHGVGITNCRHCGAPGGPVDKSSASVHVFTDDDDYDGNDDTEDDNTRNSSADDSTRGIV